MKKFVFCLLSLGAWACGPADEMQQAEAQYTSQEVVLEAPSQMAQGGGAQTQGFYEWTNRSASTCGSWQYFPINVPENTPNLTVYSQYGTAYNYGAQLYVRRFYKPTTTDYNGVSGNHATNDELISIDNPLPGTWWIGVYAACAYSGVTVGAIY